MKWWWFLKRIFFCVFVFIFVEKKLGILNVLEFVVKIYFYICEFN